MRAPSSIATSPAQDAQRAEEQRAARDGWRLEDGRKRLNCANGFDSHDNIGRQLRNHTQMPPYGSANLCLWCMSCLSTTTQDPVPQTQMQGDTAVLRCWRLIADHVAEELKELVCIVDVLSQGHRLGFSFQQRH